MINQAKSTKKFKPSSDREFMELAIDEMKQCNIVPKVGAIIVKNSIVIAKGHRVEGLHAERSAIQKALDKGINLKDSTLYTTLEPCVPINNNSIDSCAELISSVGISSVIIGCYDINPKISRTGWKFLRDKGLKLRDFDLDLREEIKEINSTFISNFERGIGPTGGAKFDYMLNGGNFEIQLSEVDKRTVATSWTRRGNHSIYAYGGYPGIVALAKYAQDFDEIDDPLAFDFNNGSAPVKEGEIAIFTNEFACALVKVIEVHSGHEFGSDHTSVKIEYEIRVF